MANSLRNSALILIIIASVSALTGTNASAQLTGGIRSSFIDKFNKSCLSNQRAASVNSNIPEAVIVKYCNCVGLYVADSTTNELMLDIEKGNIQISAINPTSQLAAQYCAKKITN